MEIGKRKSKKKHLKFKDQKNRIKNKFHIEFNKNRDVIVGVLMKDFGYYISDGRKNIVA